MQTQSIYYEDYEIGHMRETFGRTITETDFVVHAGHTGDFFPHHMDAEWCATQEFGQRIAHGTMVFSIGIGMTASVINPVAFSYGYDRLRFVRPPPARAPARPPASAAPLPGVAPRSSPTGRSARCSAASASASSSARRSGRSRT